MGVFELKILAAVKVKLARLFATEAEAQKSIAGKESYWADNAACRNTFRIDVVEFDHPLVVVLHGLSNQLSHVGLEFQTGFLSPL